MGFYRLFLAYLVVYSHAGTNVYGFNLGVVAVVSFLLLSGFVMSALIRKYYMSLSSIGYFYLDRFARIAPQFYLYALLTLIGAVAFELRHPWMKFAPSTSRAVVQFSIIPLNIYPHADKLVPQAWSLGLEATFYLIFPFILLLRLRLLTAAVSFAIFLLAYTTVLNFDRWGYRLLPGTMFIFICGSWIEKSENKYINCIPAFIAIIAAILLFISYYYSAIALDNDYLETIRRSTLLGVVIGIPAVYILKYIDYSSRFESVAGDLSYGVFLNHILIIGIILTYSPLNSDDFKCFSGILLIGCVFMASTVLSYASYKLVERPEDRKSVV